MRNVLVTGLQLTGLDGNQSTLLLQPCSHITIEFNSYRCQYPITTIRILGITVEHNKMQPSSHRKISFKRRSLNITIWLSGNSDFRCSHNKHFNQYLLVKLQWLHQVECWNEIRVSFRFITEAGLSLRQQRSLSEEMKCSSYDGNNLIQSLKCPSHMARLLLYMSAWAFKIAQVY